MKKIAILGFGIVGGGIPTVIEKNAEEIRRTVGEPVGISYILDLREFPDSPYADRVVHELAPILADPGTEAVCEAMGGVEPAFSFVSACLEAGKSVVTSNKELVAEKGDVLLRLAKENGVSFLFEASVGGGIPLIRPFSTSLAGDRITEIAGIVNGTTNYILTAMKRDGRDFAEVLEEAQKLGYAEKNPSADIDGLDAMRKIMILAALATGDLADRADVTVEGIREVTREDIAAAARLGGSLKLIARAAVGPDGSLSLGVCPTIVPEDNPLSAVNGVYNAVSCTRPVSGDILYYGRGAGRLPTAAAMVSDLTAILSGAAKAEKAPVFEKRGHGFCRPFSERKEDCFVRAEGSAEELSELLSSFADSVESADPEEKIPSGKAGFVVRGAKTAELSRALPGARIIRILR